jgi:hypothetical protein
MTAMRVSLCSFNAVPVPEQDKEKMTTSVQSQVVKYTPF